jgi:putative ABC transport system permease protein
MLDILRSEIRWAFHYLKRRPGLTLGVVLTLTAAIGAASTAFGLAEAVIWRTLPFADEERLVFVWEESKRDGVPQPSRVTGARYAAWREVRGPFASTALFGAAGFTIESAAGGQSIRGVRVSPSYFDTLGLRPAIGRGFRPQDERAGHERVVVLSSGFWHRHLGGRADAIGSTLRLSGEPYTVVGVLPPVTMPAWPANPAVVTLDPDSADVWVPIPGSASVDTNARAHVFGVIARLNQGVSLQDAETRLRATADPSSPDPHGARLVAFRSQLIADASPVLYALAAATLAVWLVACANLAALFVSAFETRRAEIAVRAAVGGSLGRLVRQLALETALLVAVAACGGLWLARAALARIPAMLPPTTPFLTTPSVGSTIVLFAAALALLTVVALASWPVWRLVAGASAPRGMLARPRSRVYRGLVIAQVAVTVALAVAAGLLGRSLAAVRTQDVGFAIDDVLSADLGLPPIVDWRRHAAVESRVLAAAGSAPQVNAVAAAYDNPLEANWSEAPAVLGEDGSKDEQLEVELRIVTPNYFEVLGVELLDGHSFTEADTVDTPGRALVNEAFARQLGGRVVGRRIRSATPRMNHPEAPEVFDIIGVVGNERMRGLEHAPRPAYYLSTRQFPQASLVLLARTAADPMAALPDVRSAVSRAEPSATLSRATTLERVLGDQLASRRLTTDVVSGFGVGAIALAAAGLYGLLTVLVTSRTRELGVRVALGATPAAVVRLVVFEGVRNVAVGAALGLALWMVLGSLLTSLLVDVSARDPLTLVGVIGVLLVVSAVAAIWPACRAVRVDPVVALKTE